MKPTARTLQLQHLLVLLGLLLLLPQLLLALPGLRSKKGGKFCKGSSYWPRLLLPQLLLALPGLRVSSSILGSVRAALASRLAGLGDFWCSLWPFILTVALACIPHSTCRSASWLIVEGVLL